MEILKSRAVNVNFIVSELEKGKIFVIPTDTPYGITAKASSETIKKIFQIKKRPKAKGIPIFVDREIVGKVASIDERAKILMEKFWPGDLTLILNMIEVGPRSYLGVDSTIAVRMPDNKLILNILEKIKEPITATSANISGKPPAYNPEEIISYFAHQRTKPDYFIDAGILPKNPVSTIIDITNHLKIIREGRIKEEEIRKELRNVKRN